MISGSTEPRIYVLLVFELDNECKIVKKISDQRNMFSAVTLVGLSEMFLLLPLSFF